MPTAAGSGENWEKTPRNWVKTQAKPSWVAEGGKKRFLSVLPRVCPSLGYAGREIGPEAAPGLIPWGHPGRTQPREGREGTGSAHPEGVVAQRDGGGAAAVGHGVGLATGGEGGRVAGLELGVVDWGRERRREKPLGVCCSGISLPDAPRERDRLLLCPVVVSQVLGFAAQFCPDPSPGITRTTAKPSR